MDYNREMLIESEKNGMRFNPITFNILKPEWRVPSEELWPERFWGLPLGIWLEKFRNGDIDAKQHWLRRDVLDYLQFDWGDGLKYLTFTWDKLSLGLLWYINLRGHPILEIPPNLVVSQAELVAKWGKPEEIQGLKLGYVFYSAMDQIDPSRTTLFRLYKSTFTDFPRTVNPSPTSASAASRESTCTNAYIEDFSALLLLYRFNSTRPIRAVRCDAAFIRSARATRMSSTDVFGGSPTSTIFPFSRVP